MNRIPLLKNLRSEKHVLLADGAMVGALAIGLGLLMALYHNFALDDSFITYRYAENLAEGKGFTYNPGQRNLGTTAPFYAILLALIHRLVPLELPLAANLFSLLSLAGGGGALYLLARRHGHSLAGMWAALLYVTSPLLVTSTGMETSFCLLLVLLAVLAFDRERLAWAGLLLGLAVITRLDAILMAIMLGLIYLWRYRALPWRAILVAALVIGPFFLTLALYFPSPLPGSLAAKRAQMVLGFPGYAHGLLRYLAGARVGLEGPELRLQPFLLVTLLAVGGAIVGVGCTRRPGQWAWWLWGLVGWGVLHAVAYVVLGVPAYHWYYAPLEPGLFLLVGLCLERGLAASWPWRWAVVVLVAGLVVGHIGVNIRAKQELFDPKARTYRSVGEWLGAHAQPQATVAVMEVGLIGYYSRLPMIDLLGLIDPPARRALARQDVLWPIVHYRPEYVVLTSHNPFYSVHLEQDAWFYDWYRPVHSQPDEEWWAAPINVYARARSLLQPVVRGQVVLQGRLGDFRLLSYDLGVGARLSPRPERTRAGEWVELTLYWQHEGPGAPHLRVFSHVIDDHFTIYSAHDLDIYPRSWNRGEVVSTHHFLRLASNMAPGHYYIEVGLYYPDTLQRLPALDENGAPTGAEIIVLQEIRVDGRQSRR